MLLKTKVLELLFVESMKGSLNEIGTAFQFSLTRGLSCYRYCLGRYRKLSTVVYTRSGRERYWGGYKMVLQTLKIIKGIAKSYGEFRENNPEAARNLEATVKYSWNYTVSKNNY